MRHTNIVFLSLFILGVIVGCSGGEQPANDETTVKTVNVETNVVQPQKFERYLRLVGTVESENDVQISAEVSGRIKQYYVSKGDHIPKGGAILKIDDSKLLRQQAQLQAQTEQARERYERLQRVFEQDSIGAEIDVINAKATYEERKAALESVEVDLQNTTVRAPFAAILDQKMLETGEMASPGMQLVRLIGTGNMKVVAGVPSRFSDAVQKADNAQVWFDFQQADTLRLPINYAGQSIDQEARTFKVEIDLPARTENYKVDMNANVKVRTFTQDSSIVIGEEYLSQREKGFAVYTIARNDSGQTIASERTVQTGPSYENNILIEKGLNTGDELITVGSSFLQDSMRVNIVDNRDQEIAQQNQ